MRFRRSVVFKVINRLGWWYDSFLWKSQFILSVPRGTHATEPEISIGITTFLNRFETSFKPLVRKLVFLFPDTPVIVAANGSTRRDEQLDYLSGLREFCSQYRNLILIAYEEPRGLSHLWNRIMKEAGDQSVLMLNDDLSIKTQFRKFILSSGILSSDIATINSSWSHFLISPKIYLQTGEFDEELKEVGGEDDDYLARLALKGLRPADYNCSTIARKRKKRKGVKELNSYGKDMSEEEGGYSSYNVSYLRSKWEISDEYFSGAVEIPRRRNRFWKLKDSTGSSVFSH